jgi:hypothetical protein
MKANRFAPKISRFTKRAGLRLLALANLIVFLNLSPIPAGAAGEIVLLHTNNVTGHLFPCPT